MLEDQLLICKFKFGNIDALCRIYEKYKNELLKLAIVLTGDAPASEDLVQDVFLRFAQSADDVSLNGNLRRFLATCVANRSRNFVRDRGRHAAGVIEENSSAVCHEKRPDQWAILSEELALLGHAMSKLPYEQREVIGLYMQGDMTFRRIARIQNASINTVQGRYRYGIKKLRSFLNGELDNETHR